MLEFMAAVVILMAVFAGGVHIYYTIDGHRTRRAALREINLIHMRAMARMQMNNAEFMLRMGMNPATFPTCSPSRDGIATAQRQATIGELRSTLGLTPYPPPQPVMEEEDLVSVPEWDGVAVEAQSLVRFHPPAEEMARRNAIPAPELFTKEEVDAD